MNKYNIGFLILFAVLLLSGAAQAVGEATNLTNITATEQSTPAGTNATYYLNLNNNGTGSDVYSISITTGGASTEGINVSSVSLGANENRTITLNVTNTASGIFYVNVTATSDGDPTKYGYINTTTTVTAVRAINFTNISATSASTLAGTNHSYTMIVTNNGSDEDSYDIAISNPNSATMAALNVSSLTLASGASRTIILNVTNTTAVSSLLVNVTLTSLYSSSTNSSVNTTTSVYSVPTITAYSPDTPVTDRNSSISRTFSVTVDQSATITYYLDGVSVGSAVGTTVTYTNNTPGLGTWNVTATATTAAGSDSQTWSWIVPSSTISNVAVATGTGSSDRIINNANVSMNFTLHDSGNISYINLTLPATFNFSAVEAANITSGLGTCTVTLTSTLISCYNATGLNNTATYIALTGSVRTPPLSGTNTITITTNKNTTGAAVLLYVRDSTKPFYVKSNNSNFTVSSETFGTLTTAISLIGSGSSNLTFYAPNVTGQTNITVGYGATNSSILRAIYSGSTTPNNTIYVITDPTVANPVIILSAPNDLESGNLPAAITVTAITGIVVVYAIMRRRRRH